MQILHFFHDLFRDNFSIGKVNWDEWWMMNLIRLKRKWFRPNRGTSPACLEKPRKTIAQQNEDNECPGRVYRTHKASALLSGQVFGGQTLSNPSFNVTFVYVCVCLSSALNELSRSKHITTATHTHTHTHRGDDRHTMRSVKSKWHIYFSKLECIKIYETGSSNTVLP
jgi:hypothetical protein